PLAQIRGEVERLLSTVPEPADGERADELLMLRHQYLRRQLEAVLARVRMLAGTTLPFDEESLALYDAVAPTHPESYFQPILDEIEALLPGQGSLIDRYAAFRKDFVIPSTRLSPVVDAAIAECRRRTRQYVELPAAESFRVAYVTDKPWGAYNWYQGD